MQNQFESTAKKSVAVSQKGSREAAVCPEDIVRWRSHQRRKAANYLKLRVQRNSFKSTRSEAYSRPAGVCLMRFKELAV
jgi:hypothetical protein